MVSPKVISEVKVIDVDNSLEGGGGRTLSIKVRGGKNFMTPSRPLTSHDLRAKSRNPHYRGVLPGEMAVLPIYLQGQVFDKYSMTNGTMNDTYEKISLLSDNSSFIVNVPTLQMKPLDPEKSVSMLTLYRQSIIPTLSAVNMPFMTGGYKTFSKNLPAWINKAEDHGKKCVPQIRMDEEINTFKKKLNLMVELSKTGEINMVDFIYANPANYSQQYGALWECRASLEAIAHCSAIPGKGTSIREDYATSLTRHDLSLFGFDTSSCRVGYASGGFFGTLPDGTGGVEDIQPYRWSYTNMAIELAGNRWEAADSDHAFCNCALCRNREQAEIVDINTRLVDGTVNPLGMLGASRIHDVLTSVREMEARRKVIRGQETKEYEESTSEERSNFLDSIRFGSIREYKIVRGVDDEEPLGPFLV